MGLIRHHERDTTNPYPGVTRQRIVDRETGAGGLSTVLLTIQPGATATVHRHKIEEAMLVTEGEGLAILGDEQFPIKANETLLAPAGVRHGFVNTGSRPMIVSNSFPAVEIEVIFDE
jgi:mannose-6-phosphate isomerase-like protein (cupin superfamily)